MANRIAVIKGTFAVPGVSKNSRLYSREAIAAAVTEAQTAIDSGEGLRLAMLTNHGARDALMGDVTRTAGQITKVGLTPEGHGTFEADIADTQAGRDVAALTTGDMPYLRGVSMASMWKGMPRQVTHNGESVVTADGFSLKGIDFTHNPGVVGARIHSAEISEAATDGLILEELDEVVFVEVADEESLHEAAIPKPTPGGNYADPGYQADKKKRYPLDTKAHTQAAWSYINAAKNAAQYSAKQLARIKSKIKSAASKFGIDISEAVVADDEFVEAYQSICLDTEAADPVDDMDDGDDDDDMGTCPVCNADVPDDAQFCPSCGAQLPTNESATVVDSTEPKETITMGTEDKGSVTESITMTKEQLDEAIAAGAKAVLEAAGIKPDEHANETAEEKQIREAAEHKAKVLAEADAIRAEEAGPTGFTKDQVKEMIGEAVKTTSDTLNEAFEAKMDVARKEIQQAGPRRRGLVLEQSPEELYGDKDIKSATTQDLENLADSVVFPLIAAGR